MRFLKLTSILAAIMVLSMACQRLTSRSEVQPAEPFTSTPRSATMAAAATDAASPTVPIPVTAPASATLAVAPAEPAVTEVPAENAAQAEPVETDTPPAVCQLTPADMLGPFYTPDAPVRSKVGEGYRLSGVIRSIIECQPVANAKVELWMAGTDGVYTDAYRATIITDGEGVYRFESHFPPPYSNRPPHIHLRVSAPGYQPLVTQHYPQPGVTEAVFDVVLAPAN